LAICIESLYVEERKGYLGVGRVANSKDLKSYHVEVSQLRKLKEELDSESILARRGAS
jgi:hypothetical protein